MACFAFGVAVVVVLTVQDIIQNKHAIRRNFPFVGRFRYLFEKVGPELRQYFVAHDKEEQPFNRDERRWVYATSKGQNSNFGFGTNEQLYSIGYPIIKHAAFPVSQERIIHIGKDKTAIPCLKIMGSSHDRKRCYRPTSIINISAMSFGSLGKNAIAALNKGAAQSGCFHNTGEGSVSPYHLLGADLMWQLGTGYFGARAADGTFDLEQFKQRCAAHESIRCIEIKLSQGAKPGQRWHSTWVKSVQRNCGDPRCRNRQSGLIAQRPLSVFGRRHHDRLYRDARARIGSPGRH